MNATNTTPLTYSLDCPRSGYVVTLVRDTTATHWWTASITLDLGGILDLSLNRCGDSPWQACWRLHEAIGVVTDTLTALDPQEHRECIARLLRMWRDTLDLDLGHVRD